jgi:hypothetical protein
MEHLSLLGHQLTGQVLLVEHLAEL